MASPVGSTRTVRCGRLICAILAGAMSNVLPGHPFRVLTTGSRTDQILVVEAGPFQPSHAVLGGPIRGPSGLGVSP